MADETFAIGMAIGVQTDIDTENATIAALSGTIDETDGCVLGDKNSGDAESGITIPNLEQIVREVAAVSGSFTEQADAFLRTAVTSFAITMPMQGNGATSTPLTDEAQPLVGVDALHQIAGLAGSSGTDPDYDYNPITGTPIYATVKLWVADLSFVFKSCICNSTVMSFTPGGSALITYNMNVSSLTAAADGVTFPTITYGTMSSLANPVVEGVAHAWGQTRGFEDLTITITNEIQEFGDSNIVDTGQRQSQTKRVVTVDGRIYLATADSDFEYQQLVNTLAPTDDMTFQVGTSVGGGAGELNAFSIAVNNLQPKSLKYDRTGTATIAVISGAKATATSGGAEFQLTYN
jgi:hypothetical protein